MLPLKLIASSLAGLLLLLVGGLTPSAIIYPNNNFTIGILDLSSSWQVPSLLLSALVCGPKSGIIATFAYLTIGLYYLPVFHGGGSIGYIATPDFGYLIGFPVAVWITGRLTHSNQNDSLIYLFKSAIIGLMAIHIIGILNLLVGSLSARWQETFFELLLTYSISTFPFQLLLCPSIVLIARITREVFIVE